MILESELPNYIYEKNEFNEVIHDNKPPSEL